MASDWPWEEKLEVAFASQPMAASPTWTDISTYGSAVNPLGRGYGRPDEFSDVQPGTLSVLLNNSDGRFTRGRAASPYYPNVKNGRRIRWSMIYASNTYVRFDGHVNEWPTTWEPGTAGGLSWVQITATDRMKRFGQVGELRSMLEEEVLRDAIAADATHGSCYYPLSEQSESTSAGSVTKQPQGAATIRQVGSGGTLEFGSGTGPGTDGLSAPLFTPASTSAGKLLDATLRTGVGGPSGITVEGFFRTGTVSSIAIVGMLTDHAGGTAELRVSAGGKLSAAAWTATDGGYWFNLESLGRVDDNRTHHGALTMSISGGTVTAKLYLDGALADVTTYTAIALSTYRRLSIGGDPKAGRLFNGTLSHIAGHSAALSATRIAAHATAGLSGFAGERTDQRVGRVADWTSIPTADRAFDTGNGTCGAQSTSGQQPVEVMRQAAAAESGVLFIGRTGLLTFHNRQRRYNLAPAFTLDAALGQIAPDLAFAGDDFGVTNDMTVSRPDGSSARTVDQASIDEYGLYRDSAEIPAGSADELSSAASWRVNTYGTPRTRVPQVTVNLHDPRVASLIPQLLAADISTKLRLANLPSQAPSSTVDLFVEGYAESFDGPTWTLTFNCSPGDVYDVWQLAVAGRSELGLTTRLAQAGATVGPTGLYADDYADAY